MKSEMALDHNSIYVTLAKGKWTSQTASCIKNFNMIEIQWLSSHVISSDRHMDIIYLLNPFGIGAILRLLRKLTSNSIIYRSMTIFSCHEVASSGNSNVCSVCVCVSSNSKYLDLPISLSIQLGSLWNLKT